MSNLKKVFKGMFKRGKKSNNKYDETSNTQQQTYSQPAPLPQTATTATPAAPPQLPPVENHSPLQNIDTTRPQNMDTSKQQNIDTSNPLPPTHPLSTGQHEQPQEAVPQNHDAQPGPPAPLVNVSDASDGANEVKEQEKTSSEEVSPLPGSAVNGGKSEPVSAMDNESSPQEPPATDSGVETEKVEEQPGISKHYHNLEHLLNITVTDTQPPPASKENIQPDGQVIEDKPAATSTQSPSTQSPEQHQEQTPTNQTDGIRTNSAEEKVPLTMEEPPPIKAVRAAPGMSATSGPLEDFPEGGYVPRDESPTRA